MDEGSVDESFTPTSGEITGNPIIVTSNVASA